MTDIGRHDRSQETEKACRFITFFISIMLLAAAVAVSLLIGDMESLIKGFRSICFYPSRGITDYFLIGSPGGAFFNSGLCGLICSLLILRLRPKTDPSLLASFFLVIAHCFFGLNILNMIPSFLGVWHYCRTHREPLREHLDQAFFAVAFGPLVWDVVVSWPLFRKATFVLYETELSIIGLIISIILGLVIGHCVPMLLPRVKKYHKGFCLYNAGLAFGLLGFFLFALLYKTIGISPGETVTEANSLYQEYGMQLLVFCNLFMLIFFAVCFGMGIRDRSAMNQFRKLLGDSGHSANFFDSYGASAVYINIAIYGLFLLAYFNLVIQITRGAGFTGATLGAILGGLAFASGGQHFRNVFPILLGYVLLSLAVNVIWTLEGLPAAWTLSTQSYITAAAFGTGLCPISGKFGMKAGIAAGMVFGAICSSASAIHGGLMIFNSGFAGGLTALILLPIIEARTERKQIAE